MIRGAGRKDRSSGTRVEENSDVTNMRSALFSSVMWVEFVVGSRPCSQRFFSGYSGFPLSSKTNTSKFSNRFSAHEHFQVFRAPKCFVGKQIMFKEITLTVTLYV